MPIRFKLHPRIEKRRAEARARQESREALSLLERIAKCRTRPGRSAREIARLEQRIKESNA